MSELFVRYLDHCFGSLTPEVVEMASNQKVWELMLLTLKGLEIETKLFGEEYLPLFKVRSGTTSKMFAEDFACKTLL